MDPGQDGQGACAASWLQLQGDMGHLFSVVETVHALAMAAWVLGLPLLFWHRWPKATRWYAGYAISFVVLSQLSHLALGECFLTTLAGAVAERMASAPAHVDEWFTVRLARAVFGLVPSQRDVVIASEIGMVVTAAGVLFALRSRRRPPRPSGPAAGSAPGAQTVRPAGWRPGSPRAA
jgi:hypothetical protein